MNNKKVWLVTGASKGLGLSLVKQLLEQGHKVAATSRNKKSLIEASGGTGENFLPLEMELTKESSVQSGVKQTISQFGRIDVVVNNAGYGLLGSLEELSDEEVRGNFDVNVFGALNVIRAVMPVLRKQQSGHIFNIASIGGVTGSFPGWGIYCATKFAMVGFTEGLAAEVKDFNVKVSLVLPGYFRTDFLSAGSMVVPAKPLDVYTAVRESQEFHQTTMHNNQQGDPEKLVASLINVANEEQAPLYLFYGSDAYEMAYKKIDLLKSELEEWKEESLSTDFAVTV
jgi:NAD(P)-dependent dehydrogenase (short-subunit alcohol dehydrogenase family)